MDRRAFLKSTALAAAALVVPGVVRAADEDDEFDRLLASPESQALLLRLSEQARIDFEEGRTEPVVCGNTVVDCGTYGYEARQDDTVRLHTLVSREGSIVADETFYVRYPLVINAPNVTIRDCTFIGTDDTPFGIRWTGCHNIRLEGNVFR